MAFRKVCTLDDLWQGDMTEVELDGHEILLVWPEEGDIRAYQGVCPHQDIPLAEGKFDGKVIMCRAHQWTFDSTTGNGINPGKCQLANYPVKVEGEDIFVDTDGIVPLFATT
jgi:toluene monooxygenase system ferredoxin subunit